MCCCPCTCRQLHLPTASHQPFLPLPPTCSEAGFQEVRLSPGLQNLLASPILPRGWWNQQLLLALKQVGRWRAGSTCLLALAWLKG